MRCTDIWRLVTVKPVEGEATCRRVVGPLASLTSDPRRNGGLLLQPVAERCGGKLALVPVGQRGEGVVWCGEAWCGVALHCTALQGTVLQHCPYTTNEALQPYPRCRCMKKALDTASVT